MSEHAGDGVDASHRAGEQADHARDTAEHVFDRVYSHLRVLGLKRVGGTLGCCGGVTNTLLERLRGGGVGGQAGAVRMGLSRAIAKFNPELRPSLRTNGFLTRDSRMKERKKYGQKGARKRFQFTKR